MENRTWSSEATILSVKDFGESNRNAILLLPETEHSSNLLDATVFGGAKSKLRGLITPYQTGTIWLYSNPIKNSHKISDFKASNYRIGLRDNLTRLWCAAFAAEFAIKVKGNIEWKLLNFFLDGISISSQEECRSAILRFLWRVIISSGLAPDTEHCIRCGYNSQHLNVSDTNVQNTQKNFFYIPYEDACVCKNCIQQNDPNLILSQESLSYLFAVKNLEPKISRNMQLSKKAYSELKQFLFLLAQSAAGSNFKTLESGSFLF